MATAGIFTLITNDGKQDRMLMASQLLKRRLTAIRQARSAAGLKDTTPTLLDIERTHVLFMNAHFKPFAAIGFEYNKVAPDSGGPSLGSTIRFSIPQFGDFFSDMCLYVRFNQAVYTPNAALGPEDFDVFRYCDYPGERLCQNVKFDVNGNPLDEYTADVYNFHRQFLVQPNKETAWKRLVGQEVPHQAYLDQESQVQPNTRTKVEVCDGFQTPRATHPALEVLVPLLFWFNKDPRLAVPSVSIPYGQRFLHITLAKATDLLELVTPPNAVNDDGAYPQLTIADMHLFINNIFVNPEVHDIFIKRIGFTLIRVHRIQVQRVSDDNKNVLLNNMKWPIETLFVALKPVANGAENVGPRYVSAGGLQSWHRFGEYSSTLEEVLGVASCHVDTASVTEREAFLAEATDASPATADDALTSYADKDQETQVGLALYAVAASARDAWEADGNDPSATGGDQVDAAVAAAAAEAGPFANPTVMGQCASMWVERCSSALKRMSITAHGIDIYKEMPSLFWNAYTPYTYGGHSIRAPEDCGAYMVTFCLYPGSYQPSGHVNVSRAREFYLQYWSDGAVSSESPANLIVIASAINFLLISDGSAVLRYTT